MHPSYRCTPPSPLAVGYKRARVVKPCRCSTHVASCTVPDEGQRSVNNIVNSNPSSTSSTNLGSARSNSKATLPQAAASASSSLTTSSSTPTSSSTVTSSRRANLPPVEDFYLQQTKPLRPLPWYHYTRERRAHDVAPSDLFMSRIAMVGFSVSIAAEALTGRGPLSQLNIETGIPLAEIDGIVVFLIAFNVATVLFPRRRDSSYYPEEEELEVESRGVLYESSRKARRIVRKIRKRQLSRTDLNALVPRPLQWLARLRKLGTPEGPSEREMEAAVGRLAQLGFSGCLLVEALTGQGPLAQVGYEQMFLVDEAEPLVLLVVAIVSSSFVWSKKEGGGKEEGGGGY